MAATTPSRPPGCSRVAPTSRRAAAARRSAMPPSTADRPSLDAAHARTALRDQVNDGSILHVEIICVKSLLVCAV